MTRRKKMKNSSRTINDVDIKVLTQALKITIFKVLSKLRKKMERIGEGVGNFCRKPYPVKK
jgi:hypothetical protein